MKRAHLHILPLLPVLITPFILMSPVLLLGKAMYWGTPSLQFVPWRAYAWDVLSAGQIPLWNPLLGMGAPLIANYQSALFYPPNWTYFLLDAIGGIGWAAWGQALLVAMHLAWAGVGMVYLIRRLGLGILAQTIAGLAFGLSGYIVSRSGFLSINAAIAWLPWVILAMHNLVLSNQGIARSEKYDVELDANRPAKFFRGGQRVFLKRFTILAIVLALQLFAGHAQTTWYTVLLAGLWGGYLSWVIEHNQTANSGIRVDKYRRLNAVYYLLIEVVRNWIFLVSAFFLAIALAAIQLIPTAEYLMNSHRSNAVGYEFAMTYSFWPWRFLTLIAPDLFGSPVTGDYWGYGYYWEAALYIGLLPLLFAIVEIFRLVRREKRTQENGVFVISFINRPNYQNSFVIFLLLVIILSFVLALGKNTPIFPWLYNNVPSFSMFQAPTRFTLWAEFALVVLAAIGVDAWHRIDGKVLYWVRLGTAGAFAVTFGAGLTLFLIEDITPTFIRAATMVGLNGLIIGILVLTNPRQANKSEGSFHDKKYLVWRWMVILFIAIDMTIVGWGLNPGIDLEFYTLPASTATRIQSLTEELRLYLHAEDEYSLKFDRFKRFDTFDAGEDWGNLRAVMLPNLTMLDNVSAVNNFDPLVPSRYARWMEAVQDLRDRGDDSTYFRLLNLMGVGAVEIIDSSDKESGVRFLPVEGSTRIRWVPCARFASGEEDAWVQVIGGQVDFEKVVIVEKTEDGVDSDCIGDASNKLHSVDINILSENPNRLDLSLNSISSGWLVVSDVWYPGWYALVDGNVTPIYQANYLFRAIFLNPGEHNITFVYRPLSFWLGFGLSVLAWLILVIGWWVINGKYEISSS